jgi:hypothetical protein
MLTTYKPSGSLPRNRYHPRANAILLFKHFCAGRNQYSLSYAGFREIPICIGMKVGLLGKERHFKKAKMNAYQSTYIF